MKTNILFRIVLGLFLFGCLALDSYGQDTLKNVKKMDPVLLKSQRDFYRNSLQVDSVKADEVLSIQRAYKNSMRQVIADTTLKGVRREKQIQELMDKKNLALRKILNPVQQAKIIPASEVVTTPEEVKKD